MAKNKRKQNRLQLARRFMQEGRADLAIGPLREHLQHKPHDFSAWQLLGFACHEEQLEPEAVTAFTRATELNAADTGAAMALAQSSFLAGLPAVAPFQQVLRIAPDDLDGLRGYTMALAVENQLDTAEALLRDRLTAQPDWINGHKLLARLRYTAGDTKGFADSYAQACAAQPENLELRVEWFRAQAQIRDWVAAKRIVVEGEQIFGRHAQLLLARLFIAIESGDDSAAARLFTETASFDDVVRDMGLIRYSLRKGELDIAEATARRRIGKPSEAVFWPYLSLIWRLRDIPQAAQWLDGSPPFVATFDLDLGAGELDQLAGLLRKLHTARAPFAEQSVRGGTQTDQNLFLRHEPLLRDLKSRIQVAVSRYVEQLPAPVPGHPLLGVQRDDLLRGRIKFSGSWSVRLQAEGFNVSHTHPMGCISSALYISLPPPTQMGSAPAGWIQFGTPPAELQLGLQPYKQVQPRAGQLVLFPSTMWHSTVPFIKGERLVVAFDVRAPSPVAQTMYTTPGGLAS